MWSTVCPTLGMNLCAHILPRTRRTRHIWVSSDSGCGSIRKFKAQATSCGRSLAAWTWLQREAQGGSYSYWKAEPSRCLFGGSQAALDSRARFVVLVLGECCQFLEGNPTSLNSRLGFWALVTWAWCGLWTWPRGDRLGVQLRRGELCTRLGCGELGGRGPGTEQMAGRGWELPFCTGSGEAKDRAGRRLMLAPLSSESMWTGKAGIPEELGEEEGEEIRVSDRSCRAGSCGGSSGPCALSSGSRELRIRWSFSEMCSHRLGTVYTASPIALRREVAQRVSGGAVQGPASIRQLSARRTSAP